MDRTASLRRRRWSLIATLLVFVLVGTCSSAGLGASASTGSQLSGSIVFLERWPEPQYAPYWKKIVADYLALHPNVRIDHQAIADQPYKDKIRVLTAAGQLPDIYFSWAGDFANKFVRAGLAADLTPYMRNTPWGNSLAPAAVDAWTHGGKIYGVPISVDAKVFLYNTKIFANNGLQVPKTIDALITTCDTLKSKGIEPIAFGNKDGWAAIHYMTSLNPKYVPRATLDKDFEPSTGEFTDPGYVAALNEFSTINKHCLTQGANGIDYTVAQAELMQGKAAMYYGQTVEFKTFTRAGGAPASFANNWDFFPMPPVPNGRGDQNLLTGAPDGFMVNAKSKHIDIAVDLLKFITDRQNAEAFTKTLGRLSSVAGTATSANAFPQLIKALRVINSASGMNIWLDTILHIDIANAYLNGLEAMLNGTKTPDQIMQDVRAAAAKVRANP